MDVLYQIVESLSKEEIRFFKLIAHRQQASDERKDTRLLDHIRKNPDEESEERIFKKLYGNGDKNAFYRLKNRLVEDLNKSLSLQHYDADDISYLFHLMTVVRIYTSRNRYQLAAHFLKKAEQRAVKIEHHELLDSIYGEFIQLSHQLLSINPETYIALRRKNSENLSRIRQMDDMLAVVSYRLKVTQNFGEKQDSLLELLESVTGQFMHDEALRRSARFRFKLYSLVSQLLLQRKDYASLETYLLNTWKEFNREQLFNRNNHDTKLQMLTYLVNSLFKNGKVQESLDFASQLQAAMKEYNNLLYDRYEIFYYNALVNNYSTFDVSRAIELLKEMQANKNLAKNPFYELFIYLNLATSYFDLKQFNTAIRNLNRLYLIDSYKNADKALKFKIAVAELIIRYELGDADFWKHRFDQVCREYAGEMSGENTRKEQLLLQLLHQAGKLPGGLKDKKLRPGLEAFMAEWSGQENEEEIIKYTNWLHEKVQLR